MLSATSLWTWYTLCQDSTCGRMLSKHCSCTTHEFNEWSNPMRRKDTAHNSGPMWAEYEPQNPLSPCHTFCTAWLNLGLIYSQWGPSSMSILVFHVTAMWILLHLNHCCSFDLWIHGTLNRCQHPLQTLADGALKAKWHLQEQLTSETVWVSAVMLVTWLE